MNCRERVIAALRAEFLNCLSNGHFHIEHKIDVHKAVGDGGHVDYNDEDIEFSIKSARYSTKVNKDGGRESKIKIVIE